MKTRLTTLLLACGTVAASPLCSTAQEGRPAQETVKPAEPTSRPRPDGDRKPDGERKPNPERQKHDEQKRGEHRERPKAPAGKPTTYLGVMMSSLAPEVAAQAGVQEGFGLLVADTMDGSPARQAGIQKYDVIVQLGDQRIVNAGQLQALVRSQKKGDDVTLTLRRKGQEVKVNVKLGEHVMPVEDRHALPPGHPPVGRGKGPGASFMHHRLPEARERIEEFRKHMEKRREEMRERFGNRGEGHPPMPHPGAGPMNRDGERKGPSAPPRGGPPAMHRDGDRDGSHFGRGPQGRGPGEGAHRDGFRRPDGEHGDRGPRADASPRSGPRPDGDRGPRAGGPPGDGPRPGAEPRHEGGRPGGEHADRGPRPDGPPSAGGPRPDAGPRREGARPDGDRGPREGGPRPDGPPPAAGGPRPDAPPPPGAPAPRS